ncbi:speckle-type POZ protein-like [Cotesia glomerata]|uniref:speckle-type POZ protein-like n=1 Tax=Cotesia glomerata TaxID=32391 RepID=UPI001D008537|nr:speckle-type POZ protein-like [Cotesia glomerata]
MIDAIPLARLRRLQTLANCQITEIRTINGQTPYRGETNHKLSYETCNGDGEDMGQTYNIKILKAFQSTAHSPVCWPVALTFIVYVTVNLVGYYPGWRLRLRLRMKQMLVEATKNDILTVGLQVLVYDTDSNLHGLPSKIETSLIANDIKELYRTKKGSDIVIKFEEREFKAHKVLLHARSSVFSAMLTQDNISSQISEISIPRVKADIFSKLLEFIYTDQVIHLDEFAQNLLEVAERYQVKALKHICEVSLSQFLSAENALRTLTVAKLGNSQKLADYVIKFININPAEVFQSNEYKQWEKEKLNPGLIIFQNSTDFYQRKNAQKRP